MRRPVTEHNVAVIEVFRCRQRSASRASCLRINLFVCYYVVVSKIGKSSLSVTEGSSVLVQSSEQLSPLTHQTVVERFCKQDTLAQLYP